MLGQCAAHPDKSAVQTCERCGAFACAECVHITETFPTQTLCARCFQQYHGKASNRAVTGLVLSIVGFSFCWFLGFAGWWMGQQELEAIERGEAPENGKNLALGAKWIGIVQAALSVLALIGGAIFFLVMRKELLR